MATWFHTPQNIPIEAVDCWVRLNYWFGEPFKAQWNNTTDEWTDVVNLIVYPAWSISRWRYA